jgi:hypothetical protein
MQAVVQKKAMAVFRGGGKKENIRHFLTFGFTYQFLNGEECPQCVVHLEALTNNSLHEICAGI